jgi:DNA damage-binding protein 1
LRSYYLYAGAHASRFSTSAGLIALFLLCSLEDDSQTYIVVGTTFADPQEPEPTRGRILVFSVQVLLPTTTKLCRRKFDADVAHVGVHLLCEQDSKLALVAEKEVKGIVYSLCSFNTKLLCTIGAKVSLFKWVLNQSTGNCYCLLCTSDSSSWRSRC